LEPSSRLESTTVPAVTAELLPCWWDWRREPWHTLQSKGGSSLPTPRIRASTNRNSSWAFGGEEERGGGENSPPATRAALHSQTKIASLQHQNLLDGKNSNHLETEPRSRPCSTRILLRRRGCKGMTEFRKNKRILGRPAGSPGPSHQD
jgi:hypothetical protein